MTSFMLRRELASERGGHTRIAVFAGRDRDHRALTGVLTMLNDEAISFWSSMHLLQYHLRELELRREGSIERWTSTDREIELVSE